MNSVFQKKQWPLYYKHGFWQIETKPYQNNGNMKMEEMNLALEGIVLLKNQLHGMAETDEKFAAISTALEDAEADFENEFGSQMHEILLDVYDELCPDSDIMPFKNYLAKFYHVRKSNGKDSYLVDGTEGFLVQMDDFPKKETKLVLLPCPLRIELNIDDYTKEQVWTAEKKVVYNW